MLLAEEINAAVGMVEEVERTQVVTRSGDRARTNCPHGENPTAVVIYLHSNKFRCWRCNIGGGPIDWVMHRDGRTFTEARDLLAQQCGLEDSPTFTVRRQSLKLAQTEMRAFSTFLSIKRRRIHDEIRHVGDLRKAALCFIELLGEIEYEETEERRAIVAEGAAEGESIAIAGTTVTPAEIRDQLANLHEAITIANQQIDRLERALDRTHFEPETEVESFLRAYYATAELREALA